MAKIFTEQELEAVYKAQDILRTHGMVVDDIDGEKEVAHNSERIGAFFDADPGFQVTPESVVKICLELMRDQLRWLTPAERAYNTAYRGLSPSDQNQFGAWWYRQKQSLITEGEQGFANAAKIIGWMHGRVFNSHNLDLAVSNLSGTTGLHFAHQSSFRPSSHTGSDSSFMPKSETNLTARDHKRLRDEAAAAAAGNAKPAPATNYKALCEGILGKTHSLTDQISKLFVFEDGDVNWEQTYLSRKRMAGL